MPVQKIAISIPQRFLKKLDETVHKMGKSRSRFIVETLEHRLKVIEEEEITRKYNEVCGDPDVSDYDHNLAEDMLRMASVGEAEEKW